MRLLLALALATAASAQINVESGYLSASEANQPRPAIFANPDTATQIFSHWESPVLLDDPFARVTRLDRPLTAMPLRLRAVFRNAPPWQPTQDQINGTNFVYYIPPNPIALIVKFHGAGGSAAAQFRDAQQTFNRDAVADGFAILALDSIDRVNRQWNTALALENNPDYRNLQAVLARLRERGLIPRDLALVGLGTSNGGAMVSRAAPVFQFAAEAIFIAGGNVGVMRQTAVPAIWCLTQFDNTIGPEGNAQGRSNYEGYLERNVPSAFSLLGTTPIPPERLAALPGMTPEGAREVHAFLLSARVLDERWYVRPDAPADVQLPAAYRPLQGTIADLIQLAAADHTFHVETSYRLRQFFLARLGLGQTLRISSAAADTQGRLAPLSFGSGYGYPIGRDPAGATLAPLPLEVAGLRGFYRDSTGKETPVSIAFTSPGQVNFLLPASAALGRGTLSFTHLPTSFTTSGPVTVEARVPALFATAASGVAAAQILRVLPNGERRTEDAFQFDPASQAFVARPLGFGPGEQLIVTFYATGLGAGPAELLTDGTAIPTLYAGPQGGFRGLDQVNATLPSSLAGRGQVNFALRTAISEESAGAATSNRVFLLFR